MEELTGLYKINRTNGGFAVKNLRYEDDPKLGRVLRGEVAYPQKGYVPSHTHTWTATGWIIDGLFSGGDGVHIYQSMYALKKGVLEEMYELEDRLADIKENLISV